MVEAHVEVAFGQVNPSIARSSPTHKSSSSGSSSLSLPLPFLPYLPSSEHLQSNLCFVLPVKQEMIDLFSNYMMSEVTTSAAKLPKQSAGPQVVKPVRVGSWGVGSLFT
jgi:hypothetical protein